MLLHRSKCRKKQSFYVIFAENFVNIPNFKTKCIVFTPKFMKMCRICCRKFPEVAGIGQNLNPEKLTFDLRKKNHRQSEKKHRRRAVCCLLANSCAQPTAALCDFYMGGPPNHAFDAERVVIQPDMVPDLRNGSW